MKKILIISVALTVIIGGGILLVCSGSAKQRQVDATELAKWFELHQAGLEWQQRPEQRVLSRNTLEQSLALGRRFLINNQKPAGNFNYQYDFVKKEQDPSDNQVRQAGALWGMALIFQNDQTPLAQQALDKGLAFFLGHTEKGCVEGAQMILYPGSAYCQTGAVALVALSIIEYLRTVHEHDLSLDASYRQTLESHLQGYLKHLVSMHLPSGHFSSTCSIPKRERNKRFSPYFDGETMLCLIKAAKYLDHRELLPLIEETAPILVKDYTVDQWDTDPDSDLTKGFFQWSCMAFWEYQDAGWKHAKLYEDYVLSLAWWMIHTHHTLKRTRNTAYAYEGIIPAYLVAQKRQDQVALQELSYVIDTGLAKLTSWQVNGPLREMNQFLMMYPTQDPLAVGGIMNHRKQAPLRIDVTQHQMHAVILALRHVYKED